MKSTFKVLAAAVALAAAGSANATIFAGNANSGNGEHVFSVWDPTANVGYVRDLGLTQNDFNPTNATNRTYGPDATLTAFLTGRNLDDLLWNVVASENSGADRLFTTVNADPPVLITNGSLATAASTMNSWVAQVNTIPTHNVPGDGSAQITATNGVAYPGSAQWGTNIGGTFLPNAGGVGDQLEFWGFFGLVSGTSGAITQTQFDNASGDSYWTFLSDGTVQFVTASVAPIPEPGTWALMVAGLVGLGAVARRRVAK